MQHAATTAAAINTPTTSRLSRTMLRRHSRLTPVAVAKRKTASSVASLRAIPMDAAIERCQLGHADVDRESRFDFLRGLFRQSATQLDVVAEAENALRQRPVVARRHEKAALAVGDELRHTADRGGHHRNSVSHRLEDDVR